MARLPAFAAVVVLSGVLVGASCRSKTPTAPVGGAAPQPAAAQAGRPPDSGFTREEMATLLPGVDTSALTPSQRSDLNDLANDTFCPCSAMTVAGCVRARKCPEAVRELELAGKFLMAGEGEGIALLQVERYYGSFARDQRKDVKAIGPSQGDPNAKVTIVEFADYQCPACREAESQVPELLEKYPHDVRWVFRNFPLPQHTHSLKAASCAEWAASQSNADFWKLSPQLFAHQEDLDDANLVKIADSVGLNGKTMLAAVEQDPKYLAEVQKDKQTAIDLNLDGTPTFFINGRKLDLPPTIEMLSWTVDDELDWLAHGGSFSSSK